MNKNLVAILLAGSTVLGTAGSVSAFRGEGEMRNFQMDSEVRESIMQAMEDRDYATWVQIHEDAGLQGPFSEITEEKFNKLVEMHEAHQNGDMETAKEIAEELGMQKEMCGKRGGQNQERGVREGFGLNQFETFEEWQNAMEEKGFTEVLENVTEDDFNTMKNLHDQMKTLHQKFQIRRANK